MSTKELGNLGEKLACEYLVKNGYKILEKNCVLAIGEIDIIARRGWGILDKTIHFVEVKTLYGCDSFYPEEHVDRKKQNKYRRLAEIWFQKNKYPQDIPCQIDIIAVSMENESPKIDFFDNVVEG